MTAAEAAELRRKVSLGRRRGELPEQARRAPPDPADIVRHELQTLARELQSSIRFYHSQPGALPVEAVDVSGSLTDLPGFAEELASDLGVTVSAADPFARVELGPDVDPTEQLERPRSSPSDSESRTEMRAVNLLPADRHDAKKGSGAGPNREDVLVACASRASRSSAASSFMVWPSNSSVSNKQKQLAALQAQIAAGSSQFGDVGAASDRRSTVARPRRRPARLGRVPQTSRR